MGCGLIITERRTEPEIELKTDPAIELKTELEIQLKIELKIGVPDTNLFLQIY